MNRQTLDKQARDVMVWQTGDRVRLIRTDICGTMAEQPPNADELPTFILITWDDGMESWVDPDTLERP
jgi:hypothetical protein